MLQLTQVSTLSAVSMAVLSQQSGSRLRRLIATQARVPVGPDICALFASRELSRNRAQSAARAPTYIERSSPSLRLPVVRKWQEGVRIVSKVAFPFWPWGLFRGWEGLSGSKVILGSVRGESGRGRGPLS